MDSKRILIIIIIIGILSYIFTTFLFQIGFVDGKSMNLTLKNRQLIIVKKFNLNIKSNDIILIHKNNKTIVKRVVGIPGDTLEVVEGYLYVNNSKYDDNKFDYYGNLDNSITLLQDQYYVLGDNRNNSIDSRYNEIGLINRQEIRGIIVGK